MTVYFVRSFSSVVITLKICSGLNYSDFVSKDSNVEALSLNHKYMLTINNKLKCLNKQQGHMIKFKMSNGL